ncbi:hypothetical protein HK101_009743 [Irineochytrium annulatum]|nr:hypothetical protein HK101_009743 [Irineochytrium annulatum]
MRSGMQIDGADGADRKARESGGAAARPGVRARAETHRGRDPSSAMAWWGAQLLALIAFYFSASMYAILISKVMPDTGNAVLDFIKYDHHYCYLLPLLPPVVLFFSLLNWLGLKLFRHNV